LDRYSAAYASNQFRALQQFFRWLAAEEKIPNPMARLKPPPAPDKPVPVFTRDELRQLGWACADRSFQDRRDAAVIAVFRGTGMRLSELSGIRYDPGDPRRSDLDLWHREITVHSKGRKTRTVKIRHDAARALAATSDPRPAAGVGHIGVVLLLAPADPVRGHRTDEHFMAKAAAARDAGHDMALVGHDALAEPGVPGGAMACVPEGGSSAVYCGWMLGGGVTPRSLRRSRPVRRAARRGVHGRVRAAPVRAVHFRQSAYLVDGRYLPPDHGAPPTPSEMPPDIGPASFISAILVL
jgi:Phage integrase family